MSLISGKEIGILFFAFSGATLLELPWLLVMHALMPKVALERYWKAPHFRSAELALFTNTVYAPMRTIMLMAAIAFPRLGHKRNITGVCHLVPAWYRFAAMAFNIWALISITGLLATGFGMLVYLQIIGEVALWPTNANTKVDWGLSLAMLILLACVMYMLVKIFRRGGMKHQQQDEV